MTRTWLLGIPRWRTSYPERTNWSIWRLADCVPLAVSLYFVNASWFIPALLLSVAWILIRLSRRKRALALVCEHVGHEPYRPVPERAAWRCWRCEADLEADDVMEVARNAESRELQRRRQSYYSNRR